jgi:predicted nucleic acid-binding protein
MNVIVDTNIVFSAIINSNGTIGDILFNSNTNLIFHSKIRSCELGKEIIKNKVTKCIFLKFS